MRWTKYLSEERTGEVKNTSYMVTVYRAISFAWKNFWRNLGISAVTVVMLALTLLTVNALFASLAVAHEAVRTVERKIDMSIVFKRSAPPEVIEEIKTRLHALPEVAEIRALTPDESLMAFREKHGAEPEVISALEEVGGNPLGATLVVKARSPRDFERILEEINTPAYNGIIEERTAKDHRTVIARLTQTAERVQKTGIAIVVTLAVVALLIVFNAIRVIIYTQREEIGIMRLVGASGAFIRAPFYIEVFLYTLCATFIAAILVIVIIDVIDPSVRNVFGGSFSLMEKMKRDGWKILGAELLGVLALTLLSSTLAMRKYLKV